MVALEERLFLSMETVLVEALHTLVRSSYRTRFLFARLWFLKSLVPQPNSSGLLWTFVCSRDTVHRSFTVLPKTAWYQEAN